MSNFQSLAPSGTTDLRQYMCSKLLTGPKYGSKPWEKRESEMVRIESPPKMAKMAKINDFGVNGQLWS